MKCTLLNQTSFFDDNKALDFDFPTSLDCQSEEPTRQAANRSFPLSLRTSGERSLHKQVSAANIVNMVLWGQPKQAIAGKGDEESKPEIMSSATLRHSDVRTFIPKGQRVEDFLRALPSGHEYDFYMGFAEDHSGMVILDVTRTPAGPWNCDFRIKQHADGSREFLFADVDGDSGSLWKPINPKYWSDDDVIVKKSIRYLMNGFQDGQAIFPEDFPESLEDRCSSVFEIANTYVEKKLYPNFQEILRLAFAEDDGSFIFNPVEDGGLEKFLQGLSDTFGVDHVYLKFSPDGCVMALPGKTGDDGPALSLSKGYRAKVVNRGDGTYNLYLWDGFIWCLFDNQSYKAKPRTNVEKMYHEQLRYAFEQADGSLIFEDAKMKPYIELFIDPETFVNDDTADDDEETSRLIGPAQKILETADENSDPYDVVQRITTAYARFALTEFYLYDPDNPHSRFLSAVNRYYNKTFEAFLEKHKPQLETLNGWDYHHFVEATQEYVAYHVLRRLEAALHMTDYWSLDEEQILSRLAFFGKVLESLPVVAFSDDALMPDLVAFATKHNKRKTLTPTARREMTRIFDKHGLLDGVPGDVWQAPPIGEA